MKILQMEINGVAGIEKLKINFGPQKNVICGQNGIGKTTILECIAHTFSATGTNSLKRNVKFEEGIIKSLVEGNNKTENVKIILKDFEPEKNIFSRTVRIFR